jgi:phosphate transport system substrate-binding protein
LIIAAVMAVAAIFVAGCGRSDTESASAGKGTQSGSSSLAGRIQVDGSSTVGPFVTAGAEEFQGQNSGVQVTVGISGTGGGFERFCAGETDISDASRPIKEDEEVPVCKKNNIEYTQIQIANDGIAVVVNKENDWAKCLTVEQLNKIWGPDSKVDNWNQVDSSFPDQKMTLAGPGTDSGTFDFFTAAINGEEDASRTDYQATEDDNVTVQAVEGDKGGLGYFGLSYFEQNQGNLNDVEVDGGSGCVAPSTETVQDGSYTPLSRPLFVYVKNTSLQKPEVKAFVKYLLDNEQTIAKNALFVPLTDEQLQKSQSDFEAATS